MSHYYSKEQDTPLRESSFSVTVRERECNFITASGLFSRDHLDSATKLLIEHCDCSSASSLLDLGCGWGPVAVVLKKVFPSLDVTACDVNIRAIKYTKKNATKNNVVIEVVRSDLFENISQNFDCILTNPPYAAGRDVCFSFIEESFHHLNPQGSLQLVARHTKGGKMLSEKMNAVFGNMSELVKKGGFRVYKSVKLPQE